MLVDKVLILSDENWWNEIDSSDLPRDLVALLLGAVGGYLSRSCPPCATQDQWGRLRQQVWRIKVGNKAYEHYLDKGDSRRLRLRRANHGFDDGRPPYISGERCPVLYDIRLKGGSAISASYWVYGYFPSYTEEGWYDSEMRLIPAEKVVGWRERE